MSVEVWGLLNKSANNSEKIEDAISRIVQEHDDDPFSHLEEGQSLTSHRASEIIDHRAESIVNDKLKKNSRRYVAIVDPDSPSDFATIKEALLYAKQSGGGTVFIRRGTHKPGESLYIPFGVDLEGEGIDETIIDFEGANYHLILPKLFTVPDGGYNDVTFTNGSVVVTFSSGANLLNKNIIPGMFLFEDTETDENFEILSIDSDTQITLKESYTGSTGLKHCQPALVASFENGSPYVTFLGDIDLPSLGLIPGTVIEKNTGSGFSSTILNVIGDNIIECSDNYVGTSEDDFVNLSIYPYPYNVAKDMTFYNCQNTVLFENPDELAAIWLLSCKFIDCKEILYSVVEIGIHFIENCQFYNCVATYLLDVENYYVFNNIIDCGDDDVIFCKQGNGTFLEANRIEAHGHSGIYLTKISSNNSKIIDNYCNGVAGLDVASATYSYSIVTGNRIIAKLDLNVDFRHKYCTISNNIVTTLGSGRFILTANSKKNIMICNWLAYDITDSGTNNVVSPNIIGT